MSLEQLKTAIAAWVSESELDEIEPVSIAQIAEAERALGFPLPAQLRRVYELSDAVSLGSGELNILPLLPEDEPDDLALTTATTLMRSWEWEIPAPLLLFADNGGEEHYGLWIDPEDPSREPLVVELGEGGDGEGPGCLAVVGADLGAFLLARTAQLWIHPPDQGGDPEAVRDALGVPESVIDIFLPPTGDDDRHDSNDEEYWQAVYAWASPGIPAPVPDVYSDGLTEAEVQALSRSIAR